MAEWKPVRELILLVWEEVEVEGNEVKEGTEVAFIFVFNSEQEAIAFIGDEVRDKVENNKADIEPLELSQINNALAAGDPMVALNLWRQVAFYTFGAPEAVTMQKVPLMVKE